MGPARVGAARIAVADVLHDISTGQTAPSCQPGGMDGMRSTAFDLGSGRRGQFSLAARQRSFVYAARGVWTLIASQHNAWIHALATTSVVASGLALGLGRFEWLALVFAIVVVWAAEALNTAFEFLCDVASPQFHPLVARAKDVAAGAVLICAIGAIVTAGFVFAPYCSRLF